jgi:eukaryotic-like serine/threonine-protein kinase
MGVTYIDLGMAVSRSWNFPDRIVRSMETPPAGVIAQPRTENEVLRNISYYSNDLFNCFMKTQDDDRMAALSDMSIRYQNSIPLPVEQMESVVASSMTKIGVYADIIRADRKSSAVLEDMVRRLRSTPRENRRPESLRRETDESNAMESPEPRTSSAVPAPTAVLLPDEVGEQPAEILAHGLREMADVMAGDYTLSDVIYMILEMMYRGFGFHRVIFCLMDKAKAKMTARFGLGENVDEIVKRFQFLTGQSNDIFNVGISQAKGLVIHDATAPNIFRNIPEWYQKIVAAPSFLIYPLTVNKGCIGMFYADRKERGALLTDEQLDYMDKLRNLAIEAILKKHRP